MAHKYQLLVVLFFLFNTVSAQVLYEDSETSSPLTMIWTSGTYVRGVTNPAPDVINPSGVVGRHVRSSTAYDAFVYNASAPAADVTPYAFAGAGSKKMSLQFYSAYPGTVVQITIANSQKANGAFPAGRHSEYQATTTKTNQWETLTFNYIWSPDGTMSPYEVDQFVILIAPNVPSSVNRIYYFDNLMGPEFLVPQLSTVLYEDAESVSLVNYAHTDGVLTSAAVNPSATGVNISSQVLQYQRGTSLLDEIRMRPMYTILNVSDFTRSAKKMTLQFYSAFPGTEVNLTLVDTNFSVGNSYPSGRHSEYKATTTLTNQWETLVFDYTARPDISIDDFHINEIVMTIAKNSTLSRSYYFDNFYGPDLFIPYGTVNLHINEIMTSNGTTLADSEGDYGDWIEIVNTGDGAANLKGYFLSDDPLIPQKYSLPDLFIFPGDFIVIWASDKNKTSAAGEVHTNFKISTGGENILFSNPAGDTVDYIPAIALGKEITYGRKADGTDNWFYFQEPTPGQSNTSASFNGFITSAPTFSHPGGFYETPISLSIGVEAGTEVRYTLDGSDPTLDSPLLMVPLNITSRDNDPNVLSTIRTTYVGYITWYVPEDIIFKATTVKARLFKAGSISGPVITHSYFVDDNMLTRYSVPVWSIVTDSVHLFGRETGIYVPGKVYEDWHAQNSGVFVDGGSPANYWQRTDEWEKPASVEFFEPGGAIGFKLNAGLKLHGGWSRGNAQKSLRLHFRSRYDTMTKVTYPIIPGLTKKGNGQPLLEFNNLILRNSGGDNSYTLFRDALAHSLVSHTSILMQAYRPSIVFLNGEYWGVQNIRERIDNDFIANHYNILEEDVAILAYDGVLEDGTQEDALDYHDMISYIKNNNIVDNTVYENVKNRMDIANFIDYEATEIYLDNKDWPSNNIKFWKKRNSNPSAAAPGLDGKWRWILIDTDYGMGGHISYPSTNTLIFATEAGNTVWPNPDWSTFLLRRLLQNASFKNEFINRFADHLNTSFKTERVLAKIAEMKEVLNPLMVEHTQRWHAPYDIPTWENHVQTLVDFAQQRPAFQRTHILDYFDLSGTEEITLDVNNGTGGNIKISSLRLSAETPGVNTALYPWKGIYFKDVPVTISAIPDPGYKFVGWNGHASASLDTTLMLQAATNLTAYFEPFTEGDEYPLPHRLSESNYVLNSWANTSDAGSYPPSVLFMQSRVKDAGLTTPMIDPYVLPYNLESRTRIEGMNNDGFAFINTGATTDLISGASGRDLGSVILAINTSGVSDAKVSFTVGTVLANSRSYAIRLQYRIGASGTFTDVLRSGQAIEYVSSTDGNSLAFEGIELPAEVSDQSYVQLRWVYYFVSGASGPRAKLRIDDIKVYTDIHTSLFSKKKNSKVTVFPNPSGGSFNLSMVSDYKGPIDMTITDACGKIVAISSIHKQQRDFVWSPDQVIQASGIYFIKWNAGDEQGFERIVVFEGSR